ncbi:MAG TPA: ADP-ribosyl-[dinitrogen reductase] hydrolase [Candidatus Deferrimicrobiaceae bacterium]
MVPGGPEGMVDRAVASFLGTGIGDALGATTEFMTPAEIRAKFGVHDRIAGGGWLRLKAGDVTDDTEMALCIARAILERGAFDLQAIAERFAAWLRSNPPDVGATCRKGIRDYMLKGRLETPPNEMDAGNGALMRMAPTPLFSLGDESLLDRITLAQAHLTHNHPLSDAACLCAGRMVQRAIRGEGISRLRAEADALVAAHPAFRFDPYPGEAGGFVVHTVQTVFHYFFSTPTFEECLTGVVNRGGDADTTGAIAGMVAGAYYGTAGIPDRWRKGLSSAVRAEIEDSAARLVRMSPAFREAGV